MAIIELTDIADFTNNYESQNGEIADAATLNRAVHRVQQEMIAIWDFVRNDISTIDDAQNLIFDSIGSTPPGGAQNQVRSIEGLHNEIFYGGTWS
jgi:hypothetical protein